MKIIQKSQGIFNFAAADSYVNAKWSKRFTEMHPVQNCVQSIMGNLNVWSTKCLAENETYCETFSLLKIFFISSTFCPKRFLLSNFLHFFSTFLFMFIFNLFNLFISFFRFCLPIFFTVYSFGTLPLKLLLFAKFSFNVSPSLRLSNFVLFSIISRFLFFCWSSICLCIQPAKAIILLKQRYQTGQKQTTASDIYQKKKIYAP